MAGTTYWVVLTAKDPNDWQLIERRLTRDEARTAAREWNRSLTKTEKAAGRSYTFRRSAD
jgi:hypothetical protein